MGPGTRIARFVRSLLLLAVIVVGAPWALTAVARARFGGPSPLHGVLGPADLDAERIRRALADRLSEIKKASNRRVRFLI